MLGGKCVRVGAFEIENANEAIAQKQRQQHIVVELNGDGLTAIGRIGRGSERAGDLGQALSLSWMRVPDNEFG